MNILKENFENLQLLVENSFQTVNEDKNNFNNFLLHNKENFYDRNNMFGHITASVLLLNNSQDKVLLHMHKKLKKFLQLGGHWDNPDESCLEAGLREMQEEGFNNNEVNFKVLNNNMPIDIDVHSVGDHFHYDIAFLVQLEDLDSTISISSESLSLEWVSVDNILSNSNNYEERICRMVKKAKEIAFLNIKRDVYRI